MSVGWRIPRRCVIGTIGVLLVAVEFRVTATDFYAVLTSTTSTAVGTGPISNSWALQTALSHPAVVHGGDTIWLRSGTYVDIFTSSVTGTLASPIQVRQFPGERATPDGGTTLPSYGAAVLTINGAYTWYIGFELTNSDTTRTNPTTGSNPSNERAVGLT